MFFAVLLSSAAAVVALPQFEISNRIPTLCTTLDGDRCIFPFVYKNLTYTKCTYTDSPTSWCAIAVDRGTDEVITNRWGDCLVSSPRSSCPEEALNVPSCTTVGGPDQGKPCIFPFRHNGVTYRECSVAGLNGTAWCSTRVNNDGEHLAGQGLYGICPTSCPGGENNLNQLCTSGDRWVEGCNQCQCIQGKAVCTSSECNSNSCTPGDVWEVDCNTCVCTAGGTRSCTEKACAPSCTAISGPGAGLACVFPFRWSGRNYTSCTEWIWAGQNLGNLWCSTKTDSSGSHVNGEGNYGFCPLSCSTDKTNVSGIGARVAANKKKPSKDVVLFVDVDEGGEAPLR